jgi:glycine reductase
MALVEHRQRVSQLAVADVTRLDGDALALDCSGLARTIAASDERIADVKVRIALPGEAVRIVCVKDVIEPRVKLDGAACGEGESFVLDGIAVVTTGPIVGFQEGIIDMQGPGAHYTPFSALSLVVVEIGVVPGTEPHEHEAAVRAAGQLAAAELARSTMRVPATERREIRWGDADSAGGIDTAVDPTIDSSLDSRLPRIAYVDMVLTQGLLHDTYVLGRYAGEVLPMHIDPRVLIDGGVVSGNCVSACDKHTSFHHQNNPVVAELLRRHGSELDFVGVVLTPEPTRLAEKQQAADRAVALVRELEAEGVVLTKEGFGNPDADLMMLVRGLEASGIRTVAVTDEFAGGDGASQSLADVTPEADALISVGNANEKIVLPAMTTVIGPLPDVARLAGGYAQSLNEDGSLEVELQAIVGATNQLGLGRLSCRSL